MIVCQFPALSYLYIRDVSTENVCTKTQGKPRILCVVWNMENNVQNRRIFNAFLETIYESKTHVQKHNKLARRSADIS